MKPQQATINIKPPLRVVYDPFHPAEPLIASPIGLRRRECAFGEQGEITLIALD